MAGRQLVFRTAPGVFSHGELDAGTRLLIECLRDEALDHAREMLDLGCGYGAIGIALAALYPQAAVTLVDVDARAVQLAELNAALNRVPVTVRPSDGLRHLTGQTFDVVASHFPLHVARSEQERLLAEVYGALRRGGRLYLAALEAYDLRPLVRAVFGNVDTLAERAAATGDRYRVIRARRRERRRRLEDRGGRPGGGPVFRGVPGGAAGAHPGKGPAPRRRRLAVAGAVRGRGSRLAQGAGAAPSLRVAAGDRSGEAGGSSYSSSSSAEPNRSA